LSSDDYSRFKNLTYNKFRQMALDPSLSVHEKVGFPDAYREGTEERILADITSKLRNLRCNGKRVMDVGPGCGTLPRALLDLCRRNGHTAIFVDSAEMLAQLPDDPCLTKVAGYYPRDCSDLLEAHRGKVDALLTYSVLQYVFVESSVFEFLDQSLLLLNHGGEMLIGDIPNISKRKRFFSSEAGVAFHRAFAGTDDAPEMAFNRVEASHIDDAVIGAILMRSRAAGFDAYVVPQADDLPMANRREDILIRKP
jgi:2-polyprenyl-3-methyl-5-hydroxy-6-metoxy-1,4-benzoquinol methylase